MRVRSRVKSHTTSATYQIRLRWCALGGQHRALGDRQLSPCPYPLLRAHHSHSALSHGSCGFAIRGHECSSGRKPQQLPEDMERQLPVQAQANRVSPIKATVTPSLLSFPVN